MRNRLALLWLLVVSLLLAHNAWLWVGQRITPDTDIMALLPVQQRDPVLQQSFIHMVDAAQQRVIVLIGAADWPEATRAADAYLNVIKTQPGVMSAAAPTEQLQQAWLTIFQQHRLALLSGEQEQQLRSEPASWWSDAALRQLYSPFSGPKLGAWRDDPFGLFAGWVQERAQETPVRPRDGYLYVADAKRQYVLLSLTVHDSVFAMGTQKAVTGLLTQAHGAAFQATPAADIITAGVILHAAAAGQQASGEVWTIGLGSLLGIILLMWLTFHTLKPILLILLSIIIGCLGSLSVCWMLFGHIHLLTLVFGASLIGVAQDYGIFFLAHRLSAGPQRSSIDLMRQLRPSLTLTLLSAVIGYLGLALTPFPGLRNMAVFSAVGLIFAWLTVLCWYPGLVSANSLRSGALVRWYGNTLRLWPVWRNQLRYWLLACAVLVLAIIGISRLGSNDDIRLLQNSPPQLIQDQIKLSRLLDAPTPVQFYLVRGASEQQVLEREETLKHALDPLIAQKKLTGYQAVSNWVPSAATQQHRLALQTDKLFGEALTTLARQTGADADWISQTRAHLLQAAAPLTVEQFMQAPASEPWRHLWLGATVDGYASIVALRGLSQRDLAVVRHAGDGQAGVQWVDKVAEISGVLGQYRQYMGWVVCGSYLLIYGLLFLRYRKQAWRVLLPAALASGLTLAVLGLSHQPLQLFHVLAFMLLLGIGVDYGIFMQESDHDHGSAAWLATGLSAANTLLSFGLLALSQTPALRAFGWTLLSGITLVWLIVPLFRKDLLHGID